MTGSKAQSIKFLLFIKDQMEIFHKYIDWSLPDTTKSYWEHLGELTSVEKRHAMTVVALLEGATRHDPLSLWCDPVAYRDAELSKDLDSNLNENIRA